MTDTATRREIPIRLGEILTDKPLSIIATVYPPPTVDADDAVPVLVCWPGGSYDRKYWDIDFGGRIGYSAAKYWAERGFVVVAADPLGVGESSRPVVDGDAVSIEIMAAGADSFVSTLRTQLRKGELHPELPALERTTMVGVGHSLGGFLVMAQQAQHASYDRICCLGLTNSAKAPVDDTLGRDAVDPMRVAVDQARLFLKETWDDLYGLVDKAEHRSWLYGPEDDPAVTAADVRISARWTRRPYVQALLAGYSTPFAEKITSPIFLGFGATDLAAQPRTEPTYYLNSKDITLYVLPRAGHCSNFAPTRAELWDRIAAWARTPAT